MDLFYRTFIKVIIVKAFLILFLLPESFGQYSTVHIKGYGSTDFSASFIKFSDGYEREASILGTPYINKDWMYGELVLDTDLSIKTMFRYNLESQNIELIYESDTLIFLHPLRMKEFNFMGKRFIYDIAMGSDRSGKYLEAAYLEVLVDGNAQLLRKYEKYRSGSSNGMRYAAAEASTESYQTRTILFLRPSPDDAPVRLVRINRSVINMLPDNNHELSGYVRANSIRLNSEDDLVRLIEYYNESYSGN